MKWFRWFMLLTVFIVPVSARAEWVEHAFSVSNFSAPSHSWEFFWGYGGFTQDSDLFGTDRIDPLEVEWLGGYPAVFDSMGILPHLHFGDYDPPLTDPYGMCYPNNLYFDVLPDAVYPFFSSAGCMPHESTLGEYTFNISFDWGSPHWDDLLNDHFCLSFQTIDAPVWGEECWLLDDSRWKTVWSVIPTSGNHSGSVQMDFYGTGSRFVLTAVPEPSSIIVLLGGLTGLVGMRMRKAQNIGV